MDVSKVTGSVELTGPKVTGGIYGVRGESAYQIAVRHGYVGTEEEWLASLKGEKGDDLTDMGFCVVDGKLNQEYEVEDE